MKAGLRAGAGDNGAACATAGARGAAPATWQ
jgi:hypothetical protein